MYLMIIFSSFKNLSEVINRCLKRSNDDNILDVGLTGLTEAL